MFCHEFILADLRVFDNCAKVCTGCDHVFNLAADMGGMGFIQSNHGVIFYNNTMISFNMLEAARKAGIKRCASGFSRLRPTCLGARCAGAHLRICAAFCVTGARRGATAADWRAQRLRARLAGSCPSLSRFIRFAASSTPPAPASTRSTRR
jgi:hypothetical protein